MNENMIEIRGQEIGAYETIYVIAVSGKSHTDFLSVISKLQEKVKLQNTQDENCPNCDIKLNEGDVMSGMCGRCDWVLDLV